MVVSPSKFNASPGNVRTLAADVFMLGFPLVMADVVRRSHPTEPNRVLQLPDAAESLAPGLGHEGPHTVRTSAWIDLSDGPVVLHIPHMHGRYFSLTLIDAAGEAFAGVGSRTHDDAGCDLAVAAPRWRGEFTGALKARRAPSEVVWAVSRITANSVADRPDAEALAQKQCLVPLRRTREACEQTRLITLDPPASTSIQQVSEMAPDAFCHRLNLLLGRAPRAFAQTAGQAIGAGLAGLADALNPSASDPHGRQAMEHGFGDALAAIRAEAGRAADLEASGWRTLSRPRPTSAGESPIARAVRAYTALGAPMPDDVLTMTCQADESGRPLSGVERYRMHFPAGALPPVDAFWSLSASSAGREREPPAWPRNIGDRSAIRYNRDGSLDLIIQHATPTAAHVANWLPAPVGDFSLHMRLHWPAPPALTGAWRMPAVERLGSGFGRRSGDRATPIPERGPAPGRGNLQSPQTAWR